MKRLLIATVAAFALLSGSAVAGSDASDSSDASDDGDELWPGMWLFDSNNGPAIHLGFSTKREAWTGPAAYLRHPDAGIRTSSARWLRALGEHARPAIPHLLLALDDESEDVRSAAEGALGRIDPAWTSWPMEELEALAAEGPQHVKIKSSISAYGFPLRGRPAIFPLEAGADFGIEVTIDGWWGRPRPADLDLAIRDTVVFGIADPQRFAETHFSDSGVEELEGSSLELTLMPVQRPDGLWSFALERADVFSVFYIGE